MSYYVTAFRWSADPNVKGDADDLIESLPVSERRTQRAIDHDGAVVSEERVDTFHHPAIAPFDGEKLIASVLSKIDGDDVGPNRALDVTITSDPSGALWATMIVSDDRHDLLGPLGGAIAAAGMTAYDHDTGTPFIACRPKRWVMTGGSKSIWDPEWSEIEEEIELALRPGGDVEMRSLEHASGALIQFIGTRDRLGIECVLPGESELRCASRREGSDAIEKVAWRGMEFAFRASELLDVSDAHAVFRHFYAEQAHHPKYSFLPRTS